MNFSLPGKLIPVRPVSAHNLACTEGLPTATLGLSPHQTDGQRVPGGGVRVVCEENKLPILGLDLPAVLPRTRLLPPSELDAVAVHQLPVVGTLGVAIAETGEVPRVGVGHGQPEEGQ